MTYWLVFNYLQCIKPRLYHAPETARQLTGEFFETAAGACLMRANRYGHPLRAGLDHTYRNPFSDAPLRRTMGCDSAVQPNINRSTYR
jgi:hypothetical protein